MGRGLAARLTHILTPVRGAFIAVVAAVMLMAAGLAPTPAHAVPAVPADPLANADQYGFGCYDQLTSACLPSAMAAFNAARSREGLGPMTLPTNFVSLTPALQLWVLANIDRVDRGEPPITGVSSTLNRYAQIGAGRGGDPDFPVWAREGGGNWFGAHNPLAAEYFFMYDDGLGSSNVDCTAGDPSGCWGHRHNILGNWHGRLLMGAADGAQGLTQLFLGADSHDRPDVARWSEELAYFPIGVQARRVVVAGTSTASLQVWASGRPMAVAASVAGAGWSVSSPGCRLAAGRQCTLRVRHARGSAPGRLTLRGPNGKVTVTLSTR